MELELVDELVDELVLDVVEVAVLVIDEVVTGSKPCKKNQKKR